jgi:FkbM family methyltransferase
VRKRSIPDVGAYNGDWPLVLSEYGGNVYSIETSERNLLQMKKVLAANPNSSANVHVVHAGVWSQSGNTITGGGGGGACKLVPGQRGARLELITINDLVQSHDRTVGLIKAHVEGVAHHVVNGAIKTLQRDRLVISISCYHSFTEMYHVSAFLMKELDNYVFEWHMENSITWAWFELSFFGYPKTF